MDTFKILIVDDEEGMLEVCEETLEVLEEAEILTFQSSREAVEHMQSEHVDLLVTDIRMPGLSGVDLLRTVRELAPHTEVLLMTGFPTVDTAIQALRLGATDYLTKPFHPDELLEITRRVLREVRMRSEHRLLARQLGRDFMFSEMVGASPKMRAVFDLIDRVAPSDAPVLISGETGTGKELVARAIHKRGAHPEASFVPVDCGAIPENLMEAEFFGYEKGAFTGANERTMGLLEYADGGTLFLDEVTELPLLLQAKLLRALQEHSFRRVGGKQQISVELRVLAASNRNIEAEVAAGSFREDLYYRLNVVSIELPPLRDREGDIPLIAAHFLSRFAQSPDRRPLDMDREVLEVLVRHPWPGNVRQLQNVLKRAVTLTRGESLSLNDLPEAFVLGAGAKGQAPQGFFAERARCVDDFESKYLEALLDSSEGNVVAAAERADLPRGTLYRLFRRNQIDPKDFRR